MLLLAIQLVRRREHYRQMEIEDVPPRVTGELDAEMNAQKRESYSILSVEVDVQSGTEFRFRLSTAKYNGLVVMRDIPPAGAEFVRAEWYRNDL